MTPCAISLRPWVPWWLAFPIPNDFELMLAYGVTHPKGARR